MARANKGSQFYVPPTRLSTCGMSHTYAHWLAMQRSDDHCSLAFNTGTRWLFSHMFSKLNPAQFYSTWQFSLSQ